MFILLLSEILHLKQEAFRSSEDILPLYRHTLDLKNNKGNVLASHYYYCPYITFLQPLNSVGGVLLPSDLKNEIPDEFKANMGDYCKDEAIRIQNDFLITLSPYAKMQGQASNFSLYEEIFYTMILDSYLQSKKTDLLDAFETPYVGLRYGNDHHFIPLTKNLIGKNTLDDIYVDSVHFFNIIAFFEKNILSVQDLKQNKDFTINLSVKDQLDHIAGIKDSDQALYSSFRVANISGYVPRNNSNTFGKSELPHRVFEYFKNYFVSLGLLHKDYIPLSNLSEIQAREKIAKRNIDTPFSPFTINTYADYFGDQIQFNIQDAQFTLADFPEEDSDQKYLLEQWIATDVYLNNIYHKTYLWILKLTNSSDEDIPLYVFDRNEIVDINPSFLSKDVFQIKEKSYEK